MKKCTWCGKEYADDANVCAIDGEPLKGGEAREEVVSRPAIRTEDFLGIMERTSRRPHQTRLTEIGPEWRPEIIDITQIEGAFAFAEGYSRPNWEIIRKAIEQTVPPEKLSEAWSEAAIRWVQQVGADLGKEYTVRGSDEFILLSALESATAKDLLLFAERTLERIYGVLREAAWQWRHGKHVLLLFAEDDDYYQYVSYFDADGIHPASGGCLIHKDYVHIAMPYMAGTHVRQTLTHELLHNSVVHLHLPLWLNEGLAKTFDWTADEWRRQFLDHDLRDRHLAFWNPGNIQKFWSGTSFREPGDSNELSYSLAEIIVHLLLSEKKGFAPFLMTADWRDAGQTAALEVLGVDLGRTAATFLGEGNWRPNRKALVECWKETQREQEEEP